MRLSHSESSGAVQYFAYPDWKFDRLREEFPDGRYEAGADIGPDEWITPSSVRPDCGCSYRPDRPEE